MKLLVTGGAGFIGSHVNLLLKKSGFETVIIDDLSRGSPKAALGTPLIQGDIGNQKLLKEIFASDSFDAILHFAAFTDVGESVQKPSRYWENNFLSSKTLIDTALSFGVNKIVFSSSAAVYGIPHEKMVSEEHPKAPINPYGKTKWAVEELLNDYRTAYNLRSFSLRYFNAAGGDPTGVVKRFGKEPGNLIPIAIRNLKEGKPTTIFGTDYDTPDGTCVRDYIHVLDLASAHLIAVQMLLQGALGGSYNLGNGRGYSVREVLDTLQSVSGERLEILEGPRRAGDPPYLLANPERAEKELGWRQRHGSLEEMIRDALTSYVSPF